jgi:hypothetical protein
MIDVRAPRPSLARLRARDGRRRAGIAVAALALIGVVYANSGPARPPVDLAAGLRDTLEDDGVALVAADPLRRSMLEEGFVLDPLANLDDPTDLF